MTRHPRPSTDPISGQHLTNPGDPNPPEDLVWQIDARQNIYYMGPFPAFYWPRIVADLDDEQRAFRQFFFRTNNYFGQQLLTDWNGFRFLPASRSPTGSISGTSTSTTSAPDQAIPGAGHRGRLVRPRPHQGPARPLSSRSARAVSNITYNYFGYFNIWGLQDFGTDVLGQGPAIVTNGPPGAGKAGIQMSSTPPFQQDRGRFDIAAHAVVPARRRRARVRGPAAPARGRLLHRPLLPLRVLPAALGSRAWTRRPWPSATTRRTTSSVDMLAEGNPMNWQTETQWLPRVDYYRLGDSFLGNHAHLLPALGRRLRHDHTPTSW